MGTTKTNLFTDEQNRLAVMLKAIGHPARVAILEYLNSVDSCICGDIVNELPLAQATISQHLKKLKTAGFIKGSIEGAAICYCIDERAIETLKKYFIDFSVKIKDKKHECCL